MGSSKAEKHKTSNLNLGLISTMPHTAHNITSCAFMDAHPHSGLRLDLVLNFANFSPQVFNQFPEVFQDGQHIIKQWRISSSKAKMLKPQGRHQRAAVSTGATASESLKVVSDFSSSEKACIVCLFLPPPLFKKENTKGKSRHMEQSLIFCEALVIYCALILLSFNVIMMKRN